MIVESIQELRVRGDEGRKRLGQDLETGRALPHP